MRLPLPLLELVRVMAASPVSIGLCLTSRRCEWAVVTGTVTSDNSGQFYQQQMYLRQLRHHRVQSAAAAPAYKEPWGRLRRDPQVLLLFSPSSPPFPFPFSSTSCVLCCLTVLRFAFVVASTLCAFHFSQCSLLSLCRLLSSSGHRMRKHSSACPATIRS